MRQIKFRAWDKEHNQMIQPDWLTEIEWNSHDTPDAIEFNDGEGLLHVKDFELMQYTGLKDKNGKEIYEGDILILWRMDDEPTEEETKYVVRWDDDQAMFHTGDKYNSPLVSHVTQEGAEVIGNIHENPELLK